MDYVTRARQAVCITWENDMGGWDENYYIGEMLDVFTKKGMRYTGKLAGFRESDDDISQDTIILDFEDDKTVVGVNSIIKIARWENGTGLDKTTPQANG